MRHLSHKIWQPDDRHREDGNKERKRRTNEKNKIAVAWNREHEHPKTTIRGDVTDRCKVKTACLHSQIEKKMYLEQPQKLVKREPDAEKLLFRLNKSLYCLRQAANRMNFPLREGFKEQLLFVHDSIERWSHLHCGLGAWNHSGISKHESDLRCQEGNRGKLLMEERRRLIAPVIWIRREGGKLQSNESTNIDQCQQSGIPAGLNLNF